MLPGDAAEQRVGDGEVVTLQNGGTVGCVATVNGSLTPPKIRITVGDEDKTELFRASTESKVLPGDTELGTLYAATKMTLATEPPNVEYNSKTMECVAVRDGFKDVEVSTTLNVKCLYSL